MQNDYRDMDESIRMMLEDAAVKPPRSVWKGVSSRLDAAAAPIERTSGAYLWPAFATAFAALLLGLFLFQNRRSPEMDMQASAHATLSSPGKIEITLPGGDGPAMLAEAPRARRTSVTPAEDAVENIDAEIVKEIGDTQETATEVSGSRNAAGRNVAKPSQDTWDTGYFDGDGEPAGRKRRPSMYIKGIVGGNESSISAGMSPNLLAPGNEKEGFSEIGESSYGVPFTVGLGVRFHVSRMVSIGTGLDYSLLTRTFSGKYYDSTLSEPIAGSMLHNLQYIGIPLNVYFNLLGTDKIHFYAYLGGEAEFCISNRYTLFSSPDIVRSYPVKTPQFSAGGGIGVEFMLTKTIGFYIDPGVRYYFPGHQPKSVRTDKPLLVNLDAGFRFNF